MPLGKQTMQNIESSDVLVTLHKVKIFTINNLALLLDCSIRTAWRRLHEWNAFASYNQNAKYHTLPDTPLFDQYGIWRYNDIYFSRHGNLTQTIVALVQNSQEGLVVQQLCSVLDLPASSIYAHLRSIKEIKSHRNGRMLVYFSSQPTIATKQMAQRQNVEQMPISNIRSTDAILILVDRIKHPDDSVEQCSRRMKNQSSAITAETVRALLIKHDILKKTADMH
jgi:hypothetical protein